MSCIWYQTVDQKIHQIDYADDTDGINLSNRKIQKIVKINGLAKLERLNLSHNCMTQIEGLNNLTNLTMLELDVNQITHIRGLEQLTALEYLDLSYNQIIRIEGLDNLTALQYLDLSHNEITHIRGLEQLTALQRIHLCNNQITHIRGLDNLSNLRSLILSGNKITGIEGLDNLSALQYLWLFGNKITRIEGLDSLTALQDLKMSFNNVTHIEGLNSLTALQGLELSYNQITHIGGLDSLSALRQLDLSHNQITHIEGMDNLTILQGFYLHDNPIKEVPMTIMLLRNLEYLGVDAKYDPIIQRFLTKNLIKSNRTVYDDPQNVHDSKINQSITQSLYRLMEQKSEMSEEEVIGEILCDQILTKQVKEQIVEYIRIADVHSSLNVTFSEALRVVWQIIRKHSESDEIKRTLNQEIDDSYCKCFTGRLSRLVNSLNGFDPRVAVKISDQQEITNLIIAIRQKTDSLAEQAEMVHREMSERGYDQQIIKEWIGYLE